eukprot:scaffold1018_cov185-Isochrysis_galbana.AAC.1
MPHPAWRREAEIPAPAAAARQRQRRALCAATSTCTCATLYATTMMCGTAARCVGRGRAATARSACLRVRVTCSSSRPRVIALTHFLTY